MQHKLSMGGQMTQRWALPRALPTIDRTWRIDSKVGRALKRAARGRTGQSARLNMRVCARVVACMGGVALFIAA